MFGHNIKTGKKFFSKEAAQRSGQLLVTSLFNTIQGEGPCAGEPATFVRLARCQLSCHFCDTYFDSGDWMAPAEIFERARAAPYFVGQLLVVTGGEPTLQNEELHELLTQAAGIFGHVQIETNGIIPPCVPDGTIIVVSPKCAEDTEGRPTRYMVPHAGALRVASALKILIEDVPGSPYSGVPDFALDWGGGPVFLSPMNAYRQTPAAAAAAYAGRAAPDLEVRSGAAEVASIWEPGLLDLDQCRRNHARAAQLVMEHGLKLSVQMQLMAAIP